MNTKTEKRTMRHLCLNIEGGIENAKELRGCITDENGKVLNTAKQVRAFLAVQKALGRKYLPYGVCDNFDYQKGCLGHCRG